MRVEKCTIAALWSDDLHHHPYILLCNLLCEMQQFNVTCTYCLAVLRAPGSCRSSRSLSGRVGQAAGLSEAPLTRVHDSGTWGNLAG